MKNVSKCVISTVLVVVMIFCSIPICELNFASLFENELSAAASSNISVGDIIEFGTYPQTIATDSDFAGETVVLNDKSFAVEPIEWIVLNITNGKALLLAKEIIDAKQYHHTAAKVDGYYPNNYARSDIRQWLINDFYNAAFSAREQSAIVATTLDNSACATDVNTSGSYTQYSSESTTDKIFLLSKSEADTYATKYFSTTVTDYAYENGFVAEVSTEACNQWQLRTAGGNSHQLYCVQIRWGKWTTYFNWHGNEFLLNQRGVRPAIYLDVSAWDNTGSGGSDVQIPSAEVEYNGHRYQLIKQKMSFDDAIAYCEAQGGHLATITSQGENDAIASMLSGTNKAYWIGAEKNNGEWGWITGETWSYTNWGKDEPADFSEPRLAARINCETSGFVESFHGLDFYTGDWDAVRHLTVSGHTISMDGFICEWGTYVYDGDIYGVFDGASSLSKIAIDGVWYEYDTTVPGLEEAICQIPMGGNIYCKIKSGKIVACSKNKISNNPTLSINTSANNIQYDASTKEYNPEKIALSINVYNNVISEEYGVGATDMKCVAGYDIAFDRLKIEVLGDNMLVNGTKMLYFKDGWFGLGKTHEIEKIFELPITLKAGETFKFNDDLNAYINDNCEWNEELKKESNIYVCAYNGDTLVAQNTLHITFSKKQSTESSIKDKEELNKKISNAANQLKNSTGVIYSPYLEGLLTKEGLLEVTNELKCKVALASAILKAKKNESIEDKLIDKLMKKAGISKEWMGIVYEANIVDSISVSTPEHGNFEVIFKIKLTNISIGDNNPFASFSFNTTYEIKGGKNIDQRTGSVTSYFGYADIQTFTDSVEEVALEQIEYAYNLDYGKDLNKVCEMFFDDTITSILSKTKAESYSHLFYKSMTYPTKQVNVHCPVDIFVYDSDGILCASVESNEITMTCEDIDIEVVGDEKYLTVYDGEYSFEIIATAIDDMDIEIEEYSSKNSLLRATIFNNISLTPGDLFETYIDENYADNKYQIIKNKDETISADDDKRSIHYLNEIEIIDKEASCSEEGLMHIECAICGEIIKTEQIEMISHKDSDGDYLCDFCDKDLAPEEEEGNANNCSHICHKTGFMGIIWMIARIFMMLFGINPVCECGAAHY